MGLSIKQNLMIKEYFQIKDNCRKGLIKHLEKAFSIIPEIENPKILDIGCGTGVPTLWIADKYSGTITAIDIDKNSLDWLQNKINDKNLVDRVTTLNTSFFNFKTNPDYFDIIIAEGFLNTVGFERGFLKVIKILKRNRYFIIHDDFKDHEKKCDFIQDNGCKTIDTLYLDENVWWNDYYRQLESEISVIDYDQTKGLFTSDLKEIENYKLDSSPFRSIYYIIEKL
jgi:cyclopropane fatty-acyl-phospholipid synthase-like methyltransferase